MMTTVIDSRGRWGVGGKLKRALLYVLVAALFSVLTFLVVYKSGSLIYMPVRCILPASVSEKYILWVLINSSDWRVKYRLLATLNKDNEIWAESVVNQAIVDESWQVRNICALAVLNDRAPFPSSVLLGWVVNKIEDESEYHLTRELLYSSLLQSKRVPEEVKASVKAKGPPKRAENRAKDVIP